ncbi:MAG: acetoacetate decarboxylase family protein [Dehalococcoidia bacterium]
MPEFGRLSRDRLPYTTPFVAPLYPPPPWPLPDTRIVQVLFEIDRDVALDWLPPGLAKPVPPYAQILVWRCPESPVGPFALAMQLIVCRSQTRARGFAFHGLVDGPPAALAALREVWGIPARPGRVRLDASDKEIGAEVADEDGRLVATVRVGDLHAADPANIHYDPILAPRLAPPVQENAEPGLLEMAQVDPDYTIKECRLGAGAITYPESSATAPWSLLAVRNMIATTYTVSDTSLPWARYTVAF